MRRILKLTNSEERKLLRGIIIATFTSTARSLVQNHSNHLWLKIITSWLYSMSLASGQSNNYCRTKTTISGSISKKREKEREKRSSSLRLISVASQSRMEEENTLRNPVVLRPDLAAQTKWRLRYSRICHLLCICISKRTQVSLGSYLSHLPAPCRYDK